jgi:poly-beta-hydroxyalkanoate depolymerase
MFGFSYQDRVLRDLKTVIGYAPRSFQVPMLKSVVQEAKQKGASVHEAVIGFMFNVLGEVDDLDKSGEQADRKVAISNFVNVYTKKLDTYAAVKYGVAEGSPFRQIREMLNGIRQEHSLSAISEDK